MGRYRFDIRNAVAFLADKKGRVCSGVLEAMALAKSALQTLPADGMSCGMPWIEIADEKGRVVATVRLDELRN